MVIVKQYKNNEGKITTKRYKIPFWQQIINKEGNETFGIAYKSAIGHPFVFIAKDFFNPDEYQKFEESLFETEDLPFL